MSDPCTRTRLSQRMAPPTVKQRILSGPISDTSPHHGQDRNNRCQINSLHLTCGEILKAYNSFPLSHTACHPPLWARNDSPSSSPSTPDINPEPAANRGAFFKPRHQTNMTRGKNY
ncbi:unnamed protein product [Arctogadus glacialis]